MGLVRLVNSDRQVCVLSIVLKLEAAIVFATLNSGNSLGLLDEKSNAITKSSQNA